MNGMSYFNLCDNENSDVTTEYQSMKMILNWIVSIEDITYFSSWSYLRFNPKT